MENFPQMFQYIQEYTGLVSPGILAVFLMGLFWKKTNNTGAIIGVVSSIVVAWLLKATIVELPFLDQMFYTLIITMVIIAGVSMSTSQNDDDPKAISLPASLFKTDSAFNISAYAILILLTALYTIFW
jgi:SSS family solute:Na+ symporter